MKNIKKFYVRSGINGGMALLIAVIATSTILLASIAIVDIAFKQQLVSYSSKESKEAFFIANAGLECALSHDLKVMDNFFPIPSDTTLDIPLNIICAVQNFQPYEFTRPSPNEVATRFAYNFVGNCVIVEVLKTDDPSGVKTKITSRGYNKSCTFGGLPTPGPGRLPTISPETRNVERALEVTY